LTTFWVTPLTTICSVLAWVRPTIWSASPSTDTSGGSTVDARDLVALGRIPRDGRRHRQRPGFEVAEDGDLDVRDRRRHLDRRHAIAERVDRDEVDVAVDVQAVLAG